MKLLSNDRFNELLNIEKNYTDYRKQLQNENKLISEILEFAHVIFNKAESSSNFDKFRESINVFSKFLSKKLNYDFIVFGYKEKDSLIDLTPFYKGKKVTDINLNNFSKVPFTQSFVGEIINNSKKPFLWKKNKNSDIYDYNNFKKNYPLLNINKKIHSNIKHFFSFLEEPLNNLIVSPLVSNATSSSTPIGYIILANKKDILNPITELQLINILRHYTFQIFKNQTSLIIQNDDSNFISRIYEKYFTAGIKSVLIHFNNSFGFKYASFWVPTKEEGNFSFGLKDSYSDNYTQEQLKECNNKDFYNSNDFILNDILNKRITSSFRDFYIFEKPLIHRSSFDCQNTVLKDLSLIIYPVKKYTHKNDSNSDNILGFFSLYFSDDLLLSQDFIDRLANFNNRISFYIEHIIYDHTFHVTKLIRDRIFSLDIYNSVDYYNGMVNAINEIVNSEHTSIYFANEDDFLYLKSSTSDTFRVMNKENFDIISEKNKEKYENFRSEVVYKDMKSITYRSYFTKKTLMSHNVYSKDIDTDLSFCEKTKGKHSSIIISPIIVDDKCVGVVKCVNKKEHDDALLKIFTNNDESVLNLIIKYISSQYSKIKAIEYQQLFIEKLAHENRTPVQIMWSAIENIELKLKKSDDFNSIKDNFDTIYFTTSVLNSNYGNLNTFLRNKEKKIFYNQKPLDLKKEILKISSILKPLLEQTENKKVSFEHKINKMPIVKLDAISFYQVIYNVLSNAIRYSDPSTTVGTYYKENITKIIDDEKMSFFEIKFENYGIGILEEDREKIFKEYYRSKKAEEWYPNGTGIGLNVARTIVEAHSGIIEVTRLKNPTIISIFLPNKLIL